jgi:aminopeptidase
MSDPRYARLASLLVGYSCALKKGENVLLDMIDTPDEMVIELMRAARAVGATPLVETRHSRILREIQAGTDEPHAALVRSVEMARMRRVHAYIAIRGAHNASENSDIPAEKTRLYARALRPVLDRRINRTRWCVLRWPTPSMAQAANMGTEAFEKFYFDVCTMDYARMARAVLPLERRMRRADRVRITAPGTDLSFSIKGVGARPCEGLRNIPDGECFSCPTLKSSNGVIAFNTPTIYAGTKFEGIRLELEDGVVVRATCQGGNARRLDEILDMDTGARRIGEFSLGFNPYILRPMCDILFDEKIAGSLHFTPGQSYEDPGNGNKSSVHWDMVLIQRPEWGGGEVWFDDELIRKDGLFVPKDLRPLNPENLR